jgi:hypothetical protein
MIKRNKIPTIIGILILLGGVFAGVILLKNNQIFKIGASPGFTPKDVRVAGISDSSATVSWITEDQTVDFISYGTNQRTGMVINETEGSEKFSTHSITITGLSPETNYYFKINSNGTSFDNNGVPWQFITGKTLGMGQVNIPVSGSVITASGDPAKRSIVYVTVNGYTVSTLTSDEGTFVLQLGAARTPDLSSYAKIDPAQTLLEVSVTNETGDTATAKIFPQSANPIPPLILGQDQDFRSLQPATNGQNPNADLNLPETATQGSKLNVGGQAVAPSKNVTLDSVDEGEVITSDKPEFFGEGPGGAEITISIQSDTELTGTTTVSSNGSWKWSPSANLSPGAHTITISWVDTAGITRTLTRSFIVQAGELPSFESTPSATPTPTPKASTTPTPTSLPTTTPAAAASSTPRITPTPTPKASPSELPTSGSLTPTILLSMIGLVVLVFSFYTWKLSRG